MASPPNRVKEYRVQHLLTQEQLAEKAGVSAMTIQAAERGDNVRDLTKERLARVFGIARHELFPEPEEAVS